MFVLSPIAVTDDVLASSSLPENDHTEWNVGTIYGAGALVRVVSTTLAKAASEAWAVGQPLYWNATRSIATTVVIGGAAIGRAGLAAAVGTTTGTVAVHAVYESLVAGNTGLNPVSDSFAGTPSWVRVGATNRWRAFDGVLSDPAVAASSITYTLTLPSLVTGVWLGRLNGTSVRVRVFDTDSALTFEETQDLTVASDEISDWYTFFTWSPDFATEALLTEIPGYAGFTLEVSVTGTSVGQVVAGMVVGLGISEAGTEIGFEDYSRKERDDYGNAVIVERDFSDYATFQFRVLYDDLDRVKRTVASLRARSAVWFAGADILDLGATVYGFPAGGLRVPLSAAGYHTASLEIEGLT